jgi:hypothetical protein
MADKKLPETDSDYESGEESEEPEESEDEDEAEEVAAHRVTPRNLLAELKAAWPVGSFEQSLVTLHKYQKVFEAIWKLTEEPKDLEPNGTILVLDRVTDQFEDVLLSLKEILQDGLENSVDNVKTHARGKRWGRGQRKRSRF